MFFQHIYFIFKADSCMYSKKGKGSFYTAQYPVRWTAQSALIFASPGRPVHSDTNSASPGSILAMQLRAMTKSLTFPPLSIARYSFIQLIEQGRQWRERKCPIFETVTEGFEPGLTWLRVRHSTTELPRSMMIVNFAVINFSNLFCIVTIQ